MPPENAPTGESPSAAGGAPSDDGPAPRKPQSLLAATGSIAVATMVSRITGFAKLALVFSVLGSAVASAYTVANTVPNMIAEFVLGAVLTSIVVPVLVRAETEDPDGGVAFTRRLFTIAFTLLAVTTILAMLATPWIVQRFFLDDDSKVSPTLVTALTYLAVPAILFYGVSALFMAMLNTRQNFRPAAWAPVLNNVVVITALVLYLVTPGEVTLDPVRMSDPKLLVIGLGIPIGVLVQMASMIPALRRERIDLRPLWGLDDRLKQFGSMAAAIVLYVGISQVGTIIAGTRLSSGVSEAGPVTYANAWALLQLPYGVIGVTLLTAIMPRLSRHAAEDNTPAVVDDLSQATRLTMTALLPIVAFMTVAGPVLGHAMFGFGQSPDDAHVLGMVVAASAFTLIPYSIVLIHLRVFYAREQAWTPTWIILGVTAVKVVLSYAAVTMFDDPTLALMGLSAASGIAFAVGALIGSYLLRRYLGDLRTANVGRTVWRVAAASGVAAAVVWGVDRLLRLQVLTDTYGWFGSIVRAAVTGILMLVVAFIGMYLLRVPEIEAAVAFVRRRVDRARGRAVAIDEVPALPEGWVPEESDVERTMVIPRIDLGDLSPSPYDAVTATMPAIRADGTTVRRAATPPGRRRPDRPLPYPGAQQVRSTANGPLSAVDRERHPDLSGGSAAVHDHDPSGGWVGHEGVRVSDDHGPGETPGAAASGRGTLDAANPPAGRGSQIVGGPANAARSGAAGSTAETRSAAGESADADADGRTPERTGAVNPGRAEGAPPAETPSDRPAQRRPMRGPELMPGASVAGGRYRLIAPHGGARGLRFWQALDVKLDREVALTFVDADQRGADSDGEDGPQAILSRTLRLGRTNSPGLARVLDVVRGSSGGIVVAEWTPGRSLREMAGTDPSPIGAARAVRALASAAEVTHRSGGALSIDHPDRIRISAAGDAVLAFPGTLADADATADVRGLGATLYGLLTARWPLPEPTAPGHEPVLHHEGGTVGGLRPAETTGDRPVEPRAVRPDVPFEISAVAVRALDSVEGIRTAATVQHILDQASVVDQKTDMIPALRLGQRAPGAQGHALADPEALETEQKRNKRMLTALGGLAVATIILLALIGWWIANLLAGNDATTPLSSQEIGLTPTESAPAEPGGPPPAPVAAGGPVAASAVSVYSPQGTPDSSATAGLTMDGNPATSWSTDAYFDPFPSLKQGVGLMYTLSSPASLSEVVIDSSTPGTAVEIRSAPSDNASLDQTRVIGSGTLGAGATTIPVRTDGQIDRVIVWITGLSTAGGTNQSEIGEVTFDAT